MNNRRSMSRLARGLPVHAGMAVALVLWSVDSSHAQEPMLFPGEPLPGPCSAISITTDWTTS
jgi:hypothetical protein